MISRHELQRIKEHLETGDFQGLWVCRDKVLRETQHQEFNSLLVEAFKRKPNLMAPNFWEFNAHCAEILDEIIVNREPSELEKAFTRMQADYTLDGKPFGPTSIEILAWCLRILEKSQAHSDAKLTAITSKAKTYHFENLLEAIREVGA